MLGEDVEGSVVERDDDPVVKLCAVIDDFFDPGDFAYNYEQAND